MSKSKYEYLDVVALLVNNYREEKPLLDGAVLFRGSPFVDDPGRATELHASLLPQVAAAHTHNWGKEDSFINTYPIDRESTRFYPASRLAEHLNGADVKSYSVEEVERAIRPVVENLATVSWGATGSSKGWESRVGDLERYIKASFYEAGVPAKTMDGEAVKPTERFFYTGGPAAASGPEVLSKLDRVTPENELKAKEHFAKERPNDVVAELGKIAAKNPDVARAFKAMQNAAKVDQQDTVMAKHGSRPLNEFVEAARKEPPSDSQMRMLRLAQGLDAGLTNPDPAKRARAVTIVKQLGRLEPDSATIKDVSLEVSRVNRASGFTVGAGVTTLKSPGRHSHAKELSR